MTLDLYTTEGKLCDDDGIVRRESIHNGTDYRCTGSAHPQAGGHIRCTNPIHNVTVQPARSECLGIVVGGRATAPSPSTVWGNGPDCDRLMPWGSWVTIGPPSPWRGRWSPKVKAGRKASRRNR